MKYIVIGICICTIIALGVIVLQKSKNNKNFTFTSSAVDVENKFPPTKTAAQGLTISLECLPLDAISEKQQLVEITDHRVLARISDLVPGLLQTGNAANNIIQTIQGTGGTLYRAILPAGAKLANSRSMENAVRGIYLGASGIEGQANLIAVEVPKGTSIIANTATAAMSIASVVVGQYYMTQIDAELGTINDNILKVSNFQDNEYQSKVLSLIAHVKRIADFQIEILENDELRLSKISQLDNLEAECTQLLGQANLTLIDYTSHTDLNYENYEVAIKSAQKWFIYQESLLDILYKISELRYTLHLGAVSREQCTAFLPVYTKQTTDTQKSLTRWHQAMTKHLSVDTDKVRRKRKGLDSIIHAIPGYFNEASNFRTIEVSTAKMIDEQVSKYPDLHQQDTTDLYAQDVQIIAKDGKIYYLPEPES